MEYIIDQICGCEVSRELGILRLQYCSKHKAAPDLYEACKEIRDFLLKYRECTEDNSDWPVLNRMNKAIAKAEGK